MPPVQNQVPDVSSSPRLLSGHTGWLCYASTHERWSHPWWILLFSLLSMCYPVVVLGVCYLPFPLKLLKFLVLSWNISALSKPKSVTLRIHLPAWRYFTLGKRTCAALDMVGWWSHCAQLSGLPFRHLPRSCSRHSSANQEKITFHFTSNVTLPLTVNSN